MLAAEGIELNAIQLELNTLPLSYPEVITVTPRFSRLMGTKTPRNR